ncbi:30S ribosomal protein S6--L-glutamate ligase [Haliangium ochraceum]|uniref:Probable alpha-L-glutamate ligase n=1 Tax=Haliangium ochraceum (strain DSM 14365 / JCM 11303 / SMP-2) TaxID=502025 RepID=D0LJU9_HALO1|nr:30S ribosomal protein S6--L-glutamate ligase [Haliangium ochraceum]ACY18456.1 alpha-L-glutamate ligase, RimK family [Haliangium ochraceum DSM 14365]
MHIAILSQKPESYSVGRLVEAGEARGHRVSVINYMQCTMVIAAHHPKIYYQGEILDDVEAIIPRIAAPHTFYGTAVVRQFEMMGVYSVNGSQAISRSRDKLRSLQILSRKGVGLPVSGFGNAAKDVQSLIQDVGGAPLIIKLLQGTQGIGVVLAETQKAAESVIDAFRNLNADILVQEFIAEAAGTDLRCFVVGSRVVAAMTRQAAPGEFRSNIHRGGVGTKAKLSPEERAIGASAAKAMGLHVAGVDIIRSNHGALVIEVNSSPGLEGIETATKKDVAGRIIEHVETQVQSKKSKSSEDH